MLLFGYFHATRGVAFVCVVVLKQAELPAPLPRKNRTVEMAQGKWAEMLIHTDRVTKVSNARACAP